MYARASVQEQESGGYKLVFTLLAGNDSWLEQGVCECKKELGHKTEIFQK